MIAILSSAAALIAVIVTLAVLMVKISVLFGKMQATNEAMATKLDALDDATKRLEKIPLLEQRMGQVEDTVRRVVSDIKELRERTTEQRVKLDSITDVAE